MKGNEKEDGSQINTCDHTIGEKMYSRKAKVKGDWEREREKEREKQRERKIPNNDDMQSYTNPSSKNSIQFLTLI